MDSPSPPDFAAEGARVIVNGRSEERVRDAISAILNNIQRQNWNRSLPTSQQPKRRNEPPACFRRWKFLSITSVSTRPEPFEALTDEDWSEIIETNFLSGVRLSRQYLPKMKKANWGRILFISSESAVNIPAEMIHYGVTKTMQVALARGLAETTAGSNVTVNSVLAGPTRSEGVEQFVQDMAAQQDKTPKAIEKEFFESVRPSSLIGASHPSRRSPRWSFSWQVLWLRRRMVRPSASKAAWCARFCNYQSRSTNRD